MLLLSKIKNGAVTVARRGIKKQDDLTNIVIDSCVHLLLTRQMISPFFFQLDNALGERVSCKFEC